MFQLLCYHSLLLLWKIKKYKTPHNGFKNIEKSKFNELPLEITKCDKISILKKLLKKWIRANIPMEKND